MNIILYSDDINILSHWEKSIIEPYRIMENFNELEEVYNSIVVINYSVCKSQCSKLLKSLNKRNNRVLILHRTPLFQTAQELLQMGAYGYGNAMMHSHFIVAALNTIQENMIWLYPEFTSQLIFGISPSQKNNESLLVSLTPREKDVAVLLKEGLTYKEIAIKLEITPRTVKAHAQHVYVKLQVKDRLSLALLLR